MISFGNFKIDSRNLTSQLKQELRFKDLCRQIVRSHIIETTAQAKDITINDDEIQVEADHFRHQMKLENAKDTIQWLEDQMITPEDWEAGIRQRLLSKKLAKHLFEDEVSAHFAQNKLAYEKAVLYRIVVHKAPLAQELFYQITEKETSFYQAAHQYDIDERRRLHCGYEGKLSRHHLKPTVAAQVFGSQPKTILGPFQSEDGYDLLMVERFISAKLTDELQTQILNQLLNDWLEREVVYLKHQDPVTAD